VVQNGEGVAVLSSVVASQIDLHRLTGGVVPDVASREHVRQVIPVVRHALEMAGVSRGDVDAIAVSNRPGLLPALVVGVETAKALAFAWNKPVIPTHHIAGHIFANWIERAPKFPCLALVVSGGHTELVWMEKRGMFKAVGQTLDDAAGEAFDKVGRLLGLPYPGGPEISRIAKNGDPHRFKFPRALLAPKTNLDFSFSGLKTSVLYHIGERECPPQEVRDIAASFQEAVVAALVEKTARAVVALRPRSVVLCGGVAANETLRTRLEERVKHEGAEFFVPDFSYCTDNAAMIGAAALLVGRATQDYTSVQAVAREALG
jgi:N6-L-threonylcarbamoyladenine synthase